MLQRFVERTRKGQGSPLAATGPEFSLPLRAAAGRYRRELVLARLSGLVVLTFIPALLSACLAKRPLADCESPYRNPATLRKGEILHLATGRQVSAPELIAYLSHCPVVFVGETHDSVEDHEVELAILKGLNQRLPERLALGLEMLPRNAQGELDSYLCGDMEEGAFTRVWSTYWGDSYKDYRDILVYARANRIPVLALNVDEDLKRAVLAHAPEQLSPQLRSSLPELDLTDPYYRALTLSYFKAHSMGRHDEQAFLRVQALWDETMAQTAADFLLSPAGRDKHLLILAGGNHVRYGFGVPRRLFRRVPVPYVILCTLAVEISEEKKDHLMNVTPPAIPLRPADFYWAVRYRGKNKAALVNPSAP